MSPARNPRKASALRDFDRLRAAVPATSTATPTASLSGWSPATGDESAEASLRDHGLRPPSFPKGVKSFRLGGARSREAVDYRIKGKAIGRGGEGLVFEAEQVHLKRRVAVKRLSPGHHGDLAMRARFIRQARLAAGFAHAGFADVYDVGLDQDDRPFLAMRLVCGVAWALSIRERSRDENLRTLSALADTVAALHGHGLVHRDLKPANVLLAPDGSPVLIDYGGMTRLRVAGSVHGLPDAAGHVGTPGYMAPEMARRAGMLVGYASDVHQLGAILHEILTGRPPYHSPTRAERLTQTREGAFTPLPPGDPFAELAMASLRVDPAQRPSLEAFLHALRRGGRGGDPSSARTVVRKTNESEDGRLARAVAAIEERAPGRGRAVRWTRDPDDGRVTGVEIVRIPLDDLDFLRDFARLEDVRVAICGVKDLSALRGKPIRRLDLYYGGVKDLSPLEGMPLTWLMLSHNPVRNIEPLRGMPLASLYLGGTRVENLSALSGLPLRELDLGERVPDAGTPNVYGSRIPALDLEPLQGAPLMALRCRGLFCGRKIKKKHYNTPPVQDLRFLRGNRTMERLNLHANQVRDISPLAGMPLKYLDISQNGVKDISPLSGMALDYLDLRTNRVKSLDALENMPLGVLLCDDNLIRSWRVYKSFPRLRCAWRENAGLPGEMPKKLWKDIYRRMRPAMLPTDYKGADGHIPPEVEVFTAGYLRDDLDLLSP